MLRHTQGEKERARERDRERGRQREREKEIARKGVCVRESESARKRGAHA